MSSLTREQLAGLTLAEAHAFDGEVGVVLREQVIQRLLRVGGRHALAGAALYRLDVRA